MFLKISLMGIFFVMISLVNEILYQAYQETRFYSIYALLKIVSLAKANCSFTVFRVNFMY
jgi:hypothetical protein